MNKNSVLLISFLLTLAFGLFAYLSDNDICIGFVSNYWDVCELIGYVFAIFAPILISGMVVFGLREEIFISWRKFTFIYLFIYLFIIIVAPWGKADFISFHKEIIFMTLVPLYLATSLLLIIIKSYKLKKQQP